jgi:hypothetical protein
MKLLTACQSDYRRAVRRNIIKQRWYALFYRLVRFN